MQVLQLWRARVSVVLAVILGVVIPWPVLPSVVATEVDHDDGIRLIALHRQAHGAGIVATVSYVCPPERPYVSGQVHLVQRLPGRRLAHGSMSLDNVRCTGERQIVHTGVQAAELGFLLRPALASATFSGCDDRGCSELSYDQRVLTVQNNHVAAHSVSIDEGAMRVSARADLLSGGAAVGIRLKARCDVEQEVVVSVSVAQLSQGEMVRGRTVSPVSCNNAWRTVRVAVEPDGEALLRSGTAFVSLRADVSQKSIAVHRTVTLNAGATPPARETVSRTQAIPRPVASEPAADLRGPARVATSEPRVVVRSVSRQARGAGVLVTLRTLCSGPYFEGAWVSVEQTQANGTVTRYVGWTTVDTCDGAWHRTQVVAPARDGEPVVRGMATVEAAVGVTTVSRSMDVVGERPTWGRGHGSFDFVVPSRGRIVAGGAGIELEVPVSCLGAPDYAQILVAQREGSRIITGWEEAVVECGREAQKTVRVAAFAQQRAFRDRRTVVLVTLAYYDSYQGVEEYAYAGRAIDVRRR